MALGERHSGDPLAMVRGVGLAPVFVRERIARNAGTPHEWPDEDDMPSLEANFWRDEPRWSRPRRVAFTLVAAALSWAVPIAAVYWFAS
jgi:hypothetical protein